jgi:predicted metal-dependent phosphoesterase TrpH
MVDLHTHTNESDGTCSPAELLHEAIACGIRAIAITDHDTFAGYDLARSLAHNETELICGIELSTKLGTQTVHLLGYFLRGDAPAKFRDWVAGLRASRKDRNRRLVTRLRELGMDITLEEVEARGHGMMGRPHFAQVLKEKGYVATLQQAFDDYLVEFAKGYVELDTPPIAEAIKEIRNANGIASLAHPVRIRAHIDTILPDLCAQGLNAIEAYHSDHTSAETIALLDLAKIHGLLVTGGSDYHGAVKPGLKLSIGYGRDLSIPSDLLERLTYG